MKTKCLIVDDEPLAIKVIEAHAGKIPSLEIVATCQNAVEAFELLMKKHIDLVFLDVEMPVVSGMDLLKSLRKAPKIIITTAYRDFALDAYDLDVLDYLLKPIAFDRFFKSISKYYQAKGKEDDDLTVKNTAADLKDTFIYVRSDRKVLKLVLDNILFVESMKDYVKIHTKTGVVITRENISALEDKLPGHKYIRTHRSFLVSVKYINAFTAETIEIGDHEIPIGRTFKNSVLSFLGYQKL